MSRRKPLLTLRSGAPWPLWGLRRSGVAFLLGVEALTVALVVNVFARAGDGHAAVARLVALVAMSILYAEITDRIERIWLWLHVDSGAWVGQSSILCFAGVLVLPVWAAVIQAIVIYLHIGIRKKHNTTAAAHRWIWTGTTVVLTTVATSTLFHAIGGNVIHVDALDLLAIVVTALVYSCVNLTILLTGMFLALRPPTVGELVPDRSQFTYEAAQLLLGVVGAALLVHAALLTPAVLLFGAMLHRSTLVGELRAVASTDAKTGLLTYRAWYEQAEGSLARCERAGQAAALVLLDLDHFKRLNDTHGHAAGDRALAAIGAILADEVRTRDCVGRFGGEEFVIFLPGTNEELAVDIAQRLRERIAGATSSTAVTASLGVAAIGPQRLTLSQLIDAADAAMYRAKDSGRNTVCTAA